MLLKLTLKNLRQRLPRHLISGLSIAIATASVFTFSSFSAGLKEGTFQELKNTQPLTQITVQPSLDDQNLISLFNRNQTNKLTAADIEAIEQIAGIKAIYPQTQLETFSSLTSSVLGFQLKTDTMVFGLPSEFLEIDPQIWQSNTEPYPALIPRKFLDIYNFTIAIPQNLTRFEEKNLIGKTLSLEPGTSVFFPIENIKDQKIKFRVIGFSDKIDLIGITVPNQLVEKLNQELLNKPTDTFLKLFVETTSPALTTQIASEIDQLGFTTDYLQKNFASVESKLIYIENALQIISLIILITAAVAILSTFLATISERKKEIGLLKAIGATKNHLRILILQEAFIIGLLGSIAGILLGLITSEILTTQILNQFSDLSIIPEKIFLITTKTIITSLLLGTGMTLLAALIPSEKAAHISPMENLRN